MLPSCIILSSALYVALYKHLEVTLILSSTNSRFPSVRWLQAISFLLEHMHTQTDSFLSSKAGLFLFWKMSLTFNYCMLLLFCRTLPKKNEKCKHASHDNGSSKTQKTQEDADLWYCYICSPCGEGRVCRGCSVGHNATGHPPKQLFSPWELNSVVYNSLVISRAYLEIGKTRKIRRMIQYLGISHQGPGSHSKVTQKMGDHIRT